MDTTSPRQAYVALTGELDIFRKDEIAATLPDPNALGGAIINLLKATYIDSCVLGMLVKLRREFVSSGGDPHNLILVIPKEGPVRRAFELTGLLRLFSIAHVDPTTR